MSPSPVERVALVTGATRGIGYAVAERLAADGYAVAVHGTDAGRAAEVAGKLAAEHGVPTVGVAGDVADPTAVAAFTRDVFTAFRRLDALVVNAGTHAAAPLGMLADDAVARLFAVNAVGAAHTLQHAGRLLRRGKAPAAVLLASVVGERGAANQVAYAASKAAVAGLARAAAKEWGPAGIRVNAVAPGFIDTDMLGMLGTLGEAGRAATVAATPLGRLGTARDVAGAVAFLVGPDASFITGQILGVDGGVTP
ncbi:glucose 1-dehydrogenase [Luedemannella flava]|uniref:Glucose 1-dehydrogenase n=1 Tax=Luedemannella flava TaxID=349316 RepID=A0ABN2LL71_9ACTN